MAVKPNGSADLIAALARFDSVRVVVAGDFILDRFVEGAVHRISPEAPIPVLHNQVERLALGGAGNVVANVASLGGTPIAIGVLGEDRAGQDVLVLLGGSAGGILGEAGRITPHKTRFSAQHQQILRVDDEEVRELGAEVRARYIATFAAALEGADVVVLSDYGKGTLLAGVAGELIGLAAAAGKRVIVDPKGHDYSRYAGASVITPNLRELAEAVGHPVTTEPEILAAANELMDRHAFPVVIVTRGDKGITVVTRNGASHVEATARELYDVSGAGDTVVAALALALASGLDAVHGGIIANVAAGLAVEKPGTATVTGLELAAALAPDDAPELPPIVDWVTAQRMVGQWKGKGFRVGFTNGCFDLLHAGHVSLLKAARARCDRLVVGLNSDASVRRLKGEGRPINSELDRATVLAALKSVDLVVSFSEDTPAELIEALRPDLLVKGADYSIDQVVGAEFVAAAGGEVLLIELVAGRSTTEIIRRLAATSGDSVQ